MPIDLPFHPNAVRRLGARHSPAPAAVPRLSQVAVLAEIPVDEEVDHCARLDLTGPDGQPDDLGNNEAGCCVVASMFRAAQIKRSFAWHDTWKPTREQVLGVYGRWGGWPAVDLGLDTAAAHLRLSREGIQLQEATERQSGLRDVPLWVSLDPHDPDELRLAIKWFGAIELTFRLPVSAQSREDWLDADVGGRDWGLHRAPCGRYDRNGLKPISWGKYYPVSPEFEQARLVAADATISRIWLRTGSKTPYDDTWEDLFRRRQWLDNT